MLTSASVLQAAFTATTFREGYEQGAVTALLERVGAALAEWERDGTSRPRLTADEVAAARLPVTRFAQGVDQDEVDVFLDSVVAALREHEAAADAADAADAAAPRVDETALVAAAGIRRLRFGTTWWRAGYSRPGVDGFLAAVEETLAAHERREGGDAALSAADVANVRFRPTRLRPGYVIDEVDAVIPGIVDTLVRHESAGGGSR
jgi:DivIVA domain-containing protein